MIALGAMRPNRSEGEVRLAAQITMSGANGTCSRRVAFSTSVQHGAESTQAHDPRSSIDCTGGSGPNAAEVVVDVFAIQAVRRNEAVDVQAARFRAGG